MTSDSSTFDYDLAVIGGGSGGLACAKMAAQYSVDGRPVKVCLFDFVKPSTQNTKWGLGGTCVNVGCVPKKLMHYAATIGSLMEHDKKPMGWLNKNDDDKNGGSTDVKHTNEHDWNKLVETVQNYIRSLNFSYWVGLRSAKVEYINSLAKFVDSKTLLYTWKGEEKKISCRNIVIATGGRPTVPEDVVNAKELAISSDDIFSLKTIPGKTLVVGASYIALECGGFLNELGYDVTIAVRSILLRGFDQQCAKKIGLTMEELGVKFKHETLPAKMEKLPNDQIQVQFSNGDKDVFDTVLYAVGRYADTAGINPGAAGLKVESNGKLKCINEQTSVPNIYAVGDILFGRPELTPVAIRAGELLAKRLFGGSTMQMDYENVPTAVFTPFEYGSCGLSEEEAESRYGKDNLEVYLFEFSPLELSATHREKKMDKKNSDDDLSITPPCLSKLICLKNENERVVGFHFIGPNAGEATQGMGLSIKLGAKKSDFDSCVGIHPTNIESFMTMSITRRSGMDWMATGGCGGGKCG